MKSAGKARNNGLYRHIRTSKEIIRNLLNDFINIVIPVSADFHKIRNPDRDIHTYHFRRSSPDFPNFFVDLMIC